ncbi:unnamed protein product [Pelagomonas calceolata]|uniref:MYND-type domain-containing protein n=1 Tax=Pelagomonas calceolata TaxID=35677 RepID=A0A8J2X6R2_9STRA|nr:unnamed protein product [Pelagomonas calceolata]
MADGAAVIGSSKQIKLELLGIALKSYDWVTNHIELFEAGECDLSLNTLISVASKHLVAIENWHLNCMSVDASDLEWSEIFRDAIPSIYKWIGRWRDAATEAASLGLGGYISCKYWKQNIELPEVITKARKWFALAEQLVKKLPLPRKSIIKGHTFISAVAKCRRFWPRYRCLSIVGWVHKWSLLLAKWAHTRAYFNKCEFDAHYLTLAEAQDALTRLEKQQTAFRAIMLKKRTCAHCGTTGPLSQRSFAYCGGCRDSGVARVDWSRYCSEACQRAHWVAGHKDECPCAH